MRKREKEVGGLLFSVLLSLAAVADTQVALLIALALDLRRAQSRERSKKKTLF